MTDSLFVYEPHSTIISSIFSSNSEALASELLDDIEECVVEFSFYDIGVIKSHGEFRNQKATVNSTRYFQN